MVKGHGQHLVGERVWSTQACNVVYLGGVGASLTGICRWWITCRVRRHSLDAVVDELVLESGGCDGKTDEVH